MAERTTADARAPPPIAAATATPSAACPAARGMTGIRVLESGSAIDEGKQEKRIGGIKVLTAGKGGALGSISTAGGEGGMKTLKGLRVWGGAGGAHEPTPGVDIQESVARGVPVGSQPTGWAEYADKNDRLYYHHSASKTTQWAAPTWIQSGQGVISSVGASASAAADGMAGPAAGSTLADTGAGAAGARTGTGVAGETSTTAPMIKKRPRGRTKGSKNPSTVDGKRKKEFTKLPSEKIWEQWCGILCWLGNDTDMDGDIFLFCSMCRDRLARGQLAVPNVFTSGCYSIKKNSITRHVHSWHMHDRHEPTTAMMS
jgi:hypothetical protein